jgi:hypothetical protein
VVFSLRSLRSFSTDIALATSVAAIPNLRDLCALVVKFYGTIRI